MMKFSTIERNPDTKQLEVVFSFNDNLTVSIPMRKDKKTIPMIESLARLSGCDADFFISEYKAIYEELKMYTEYRKKFVDKVGVSNFMYNQILQEIICGRILTMNEIYWFDWYIKKNKLSLSNYE